MEIPRLTADSRQLLLRNIELDYLWNSPMALDKRFARGLGGGLRPDGARKDEKLR